MIRSGKAIAVATALVAATAAYAAGGKLVGEGDKVPRGTLVTGECWDRSTDDTIEGHHTAQTYFYDLAEPGESSSGTSQGVLPPDCEPVRLEEVARYEAITTYTKGLDQTQRKYYFEVVDGTPKALHRSFVLAANAHSATWRAFAAAGKKSAAACARADWTQAEELAAMGEDTFREQLVPRHAAMADALEALADAEKKVKRGKRAAFRKAIEQYRAAVRLRKASQTSFRAALLAFGDRDCPEGLRLRKRGVEQGHDATAHLRKAGRLMPAL